MTPDIEMALDDWRRINSNERKWAKFDAIYHNEDFRLVRVEWGPKRGKTKEFALQSFYYSVLPNGKAYRVICNHP